MHRSVVAVAVAALAAGVALAVAAVVAAAATASVGAAAVREGPGCMAGGAGCVVGSAAGVGGAVHAAEGAAGGAVGGAWLLEWRGGEPECHSGEESAVVDITTAEAMKSLEAPGQFRNPGPDDVAKIHVSLMCRSKEGGKAALKVRAA